MLSSSEKNETIPRVQHGETTIEIYPIPGIDSRMYVSVCANEALIVDPNVNEAALTKLRCCQVDKVLVLLTHEHIDHISGVNWLRENFQTTVACSQICGQRIMEPTSSFAAFWQVFVKMSHIGGAEVQTEKRFTNTYTCTADMTYQKGTTLNWQGHTIHMQEAPGHSPGGSLIFLDDKFLFTGDNLVNGAEVILRMPGGNAKEYRKKTWPLLENLPDDMIVLPGHGEPARLKELRLWGGVEESEKSGKPD